MPYIGRREWARVVVLALILVAVSHVPYLVGFHSGPADSVFGGFVLNGLDGNTYLAAMQQGMQGQWQFHLLYTSEEHKGSFLYVFYVVLGHVASFLGASAVAVYHGARLVCGFLLLMAEFVFIAYFLACPSARWIAFILVSCSSGLGWLVLLVTGSSAINGISPLDFWLMDAYTFFTILHAPHFCLVLALMLMLLMFTLSFYRAGRRRLLGLAAFAALGIAVINPFLPLIVGTVLGAYWCVWAVQCRAIPWREAVGLALLGLLLSPVLIYFYVVVQSDPVLRSFAEQNVTLSPPPYFYLMGYGLVLLFALLGLLRTLRQRHGRAWLLATWVVTMAVAVYLPINLQRRMITGLQVPLGILATIGLLRYVLPAIRRSRLAGWLNQHWGYPRLRLRTLALNLIIMLTLPSNIYLWVSATAAASYGHPSLFYKTSEVAAIDWLGEHSSPTDTVLSSYPTGNYIPARIGHRVFLGHWAETIDFDAKQKAVNRFFAAATSDGERRDLLRRYSLAYVFHGPREQSLGGFDPTKAHYLRLAFTQQNVNIYQVIPGSWQ